ILAYEGETLVRIIYYKKNYSKATYFIATLRIRQMRRSVSKKLLERIQNILRHSRGFTTTGLTLYYSHLIMNNVMNNLSSFGGDWELIFLVGSVCKKFLFNLFLPFPQILLIFRCQDLRKNKLRGE